MTGFLLDTNIPSEIMRRMPDARVSAWLKMQPKESQFLSVVTIGEIIKGAVILPLSTKRTQIEQSLEVLIPSWFAGRILPMTQAIADHWGVLEGQRQLAGRPLNVPDGMIAATALEHGLTIVTRNVKGFRRSGRGAPESLGIMSTTAVILAPVVQARPVPAVFAGPAQAERRFWEFFTTQINNDNTRKSYFNAVWYFSAWCQSRNIAELHQVEPMHIAAYLKALEKEERSAPTIKQHLAALRMLFDWLVIGQVIPLNPAHAVRGPKHIVKKGKTPVLNTDEARALLDKIDTATLPGLRDRALIGVMVYTFARVNAALEMKVKDYYVQGRRGWVHLHEKGGKEHTVPCHHNLEAYIDEYIAAAGIAEDADGWLFRTAAGRTGSLTISQMWQQDAYRMIQRRAKAAGIKTKIGNHTFRATGITAYMRNGGKLETAQQIANHESPRTTKLYDRREEEISLDEVERIMI